MCDAGADNEESLTFTDILASIHFNNSVCRVPAYYLFFFFFFFFFFNTTDNDLLEED